MGDLLVRGGTLVDGSGAPARRADVRVRGGWIAEVGEGLRSDGEPVLEAGGAFVAPGFIDAHTHCDPALFWDPFCDPVPLHGVTAVVTGNCSLSLAPLRAEHRGLLADMFCFIEDMPVTAFERGVPFDWETWSEYRASFERRGAAVNVVPLVGHSLLRLHVAGEETFERASTPEERRAVARLFSECLRAGGFGLSTSFQDVDRHGRPVPSRAADDEEFLALAAEMRALGRGVIEFVPRFTELEHQMADIERMHATGSAAGVPATWTQLAASDRNPGGVARLLEQAARTQTEAWGVFPQVSPRPFDINVSFERTAAFAFQPTWGALVQADPPQKRAWLADPAWRAKARAEWDRVRFSIFPTRRLEKVRLTRVPRPEQRHLLGASLADLVAERGGHPSDVLADWVLENDLDPGIAVVGLANEDPAEVAKLLLHPNVIVGASDAGAHVQMMCGAGDTSLLLARHVHERGDLPLEQAVRLVTSRVAEVFGVRDRGRVAPGYAGDLVVFELERVAYPDDTRLEDLPGGGSRISRPTGGHRATIVAGVPTQLEGKPTGALPGRMLDPESGPRA